MTDKKKSEQYKVIKRLEKMGISPEEIINIAKSAKKNTNSRGGSYTIGKEKVKYLAISDTHIGSSHYDSKLMDLAAKVADDEDVDFVVHVGDVLEGWYQNRPTQLFETTELGADQQMKKAVRELAKFNKPLYFITANHEYNTYMRSAGLEVGWVIEKMLLEMGKEVKFLGNMEGDIFLKNGTQIKLLHPDGGSSYAISYKSQKIAESLEAGKKPHILHIGHFHKAEYLFYRNIHILQAGCFQNQTKFMKGKQLSAHKGFWLVEVAGKKRGKYRGQVDYINPRFYPAYE